MKKSKILVPALGILVLSTAASITGTVAWFTAANSAEIKGFNMMAEAEDGIVVANETHTADAHWSTSALASHDGQITNPAHAEDPSAPEKIQAGFIPTSTANIATWYHSNSGSADSYEHKSDYTSYTGSQITEKEADSGVYKIAYSETVDKNIYLLNKFYIQSSSPSAINGQDIYVKNLSAVSATSFSTALNKSLRIAFAYGTPGSTPTFGKIFAPFTGTTTTKYMVASNLFSTTSSYSVGNIVSYNGTFYKCTTAITASSESPAEWDASKWTSTLADEDYSVIAVTDTSSEVIFAENQNLGEYTVGGTHALEISVFAYFEGEDVNCKSANLVATLDKIAISFTLGNKSHI